jgi:hypothetical protein
MGAKLDTLPLYFKKSFNLGWHKETQKSYAACVHFICIRNLNIWILTKCLENLVTLRKYLGTIITSQKLYSRQLASYHSVRNILLSRVLSKNFKLQTGHTRNYNLTCRFLGAKLGLSLRGTNGGCVRYEIEMLGRTLLPSRCSKQTNYQKLTAGSRSEFTSLFHYNLYIRFD